MAIDVDADRHRHRGAQTSLLSNPDHRHRQGDARVATETDAARDRVLAARAVARRRAGGPRGLGSRCGRHPGEDQAQPGQGRRRRRWCGVPRARRSEAGLPRAARRAVTGEPDPLPPSMLPEEIDKALRALGDDGKKVRGALERDFTAYAKKREKDRSGLRTLLLRVGRAAAAVCGRQDSRDPIVQHRRRRLPGATRADP